MNKIKEKRRKETQLKLNSNENQFFRSAKKKTTTQQINKQTNKRNR